jgi:DNA-binding MarR family transcriptional regulator
MRALEGGMQLTRLHHWIIGFLYHHEGDIYQKDIETEFKISRSTTSSVLTLMEKKGLLTRESVMSDARLKKVVLTDKAIKMHKQQMADMQRVDAIIEGALTPEEKKQFLACMEKIRTAVMEKLDTDNPHLDD